jgi:N-acetylglucosamine transport system substrate-binding protein
MERWFIVLCCCGGLAACDAVHPLPEAEAGATSLEVAVFEGGYGIEWHRDMAAAYPDADVTLWGSPRVAEVVKPRLLRGDPPDLIIEMRLPLWMLIRAGKLVPFDDALAAAPPGASAPWRDLFRRNALDAYRTREHVFAVPTSMTVWGCWYDAALFREHGWEPPRTWREFDALCTEIADAGIAPLAFQGKYPSYAAFTLYALVQRVGGVALVNRINEPDPAAFTDARFIRAAALLQRLARDHFQPGALAMTHIESQLQFVNGRAAMIFCGTWLENEMKASIPPAFELRLFNVPAVEGGIGNPAAVSGMASEFMFVPEDARHPEAAFDFARYLVSPEAAASMAASIGVISPLRDATPAERLSRAQRSALAVLDASPGVFTVRLDALLVEWAPQVLRPGLAGLLRGDLTPEAFGRFLRDGMVAVLEAQHDPLPPPMPYRPDAFGEPYAAG